MGRIRRVSLLAGLLLFPALLFAQFNNNTTSPYSRFGLGDLQPYSFGRTTAMGGASLASRNNQQINMANPASYTSVDSLSFLFEFGVFGKFSQFSNNNTKINSNDVNFRYFAMNFRITNWLASSLGLTPYSDVGYNVDVIENVVNAGDVRYSYFGEGSLSKAYLGLAVEPIPNISVGANLNYMFGTLARNTEVEFDNFHADYYEIQKYEALRIRDFNLNFGVQVTLPLKENQHFVLAAVIENQPKYTGFYSDFNSKLLTYTIGSSSNSDRDTLNFQNEEKSQIQLPLSYGFGLSYVRDNTFEANFDYYHQKWSKVKIPGSINSVLTNLDKFAIGAEWIPDRFSIRSYLSRIAYRAGIKYEKSYLIIKNTDVPDGKQINDFGISFGVGLPVYRSNSTINVSAELGKRGTKDNNLVLENYAKINLSVNLYDLWFIQRRFD